MEKRWPFSTTREGVYVADKDGQAITRIFEPDASVLATSRRSCIVPLDGRLIFTTAYHTDGTPRVSRRPISFALRRPKGRSSMGKVR